MNKLIESQISQINFKEFFVLQLISEFCEDCVTNHQEFHIFQGGRNFNLKNWNFNKFLEN